MTEIIYKSRKTRVPHDVFMKHIGYFVLQVRKEREDERFIRLKADEMRQFIHECGTHHTGYISKEALRVMKMKAASVKTSERVTLEHFNSRLNSAKKIVRFILESPLPEGPELYEEIYELVLKSCRVHKTTAEENQRLTRIQHDPQYVDAGWRVQYAAAGIELVYSGTEFEHDGKIYRCFAQNERKAMFGLTTYQLVKLRRNERARETSQ